MRELCRLDVMSARAPSTHRSPSVLKGWPTLLAVEKRLPMSHKIFPNAGAKTEKAVLCSECFASEGLRLDALRFGISDSSVCPNCGSLSGAKLTKVDLNGLVSRFFVWGTMVRLEYGGAPTIQVNQT